MDLRRMLPLGGIVFVALVVLAIVAFGGTTPGTDDSAEKIASFYDTHSVRQAVAAFVIAASVPFLVVFAIALADAAATESRTWTSWPRVLVAGSAVTAAIILIVAMIHFALADGADNDVAPAGLQALNTLDNDLWVAFNPALGVMMLGAAGTSLTRATTYRWLGWTALVLGVALFIPFADFFALLLTGVWMIVTSILLFSRRLGFSDAAARPEAIATAAPQEVPSRSNPAAPSS
jgi:hypothetical protein